MLIETAKAVAEPVADETLATGLIYPPQSHILEASLNTAIRVATYIFDHDLAGVPRPDDIAVHVRERADRPLFRDTPRP